jgi:phytoene dehydrogenase-like protein
MNDFVVVGGGIGGSSSAALLTQKGYKTLLVEKEPYLGGASSTFTHQGFRYNAGATTFSGYEAGHQVKALFESLKLRPKLLYTDPSLVVIHHNIHVKRYRDVTRLIDEVNRAYYHPKNSDFWQLVAMINATFYTYQSHYLSGASWMKKLQSLLSFLPMGKKFAPYIFHNAYTFINNYFEPLSQEYYQFLDAQVMIVAQAPLQQINFLTAALALGYTFNQNYYVVGGMGELFGLLRSRIGEVHTQTMIKKIIRTKERYLLLTNDRVIESKNIVLNGTVYDNAQLFDDQQIHSYYQNYASLNNYQSAFVVYMTIKSDHAFAHHYQIIAQEAMDYTLSNALFVSFSDQADDKLAPKGHYSITASIHTDLRWWTRQCETVYQLRKAHLEQKLTQLICATLKLDQTDVVARFSATPKTFKRYINRAQLGGNPMQMRNLLFNTPANDTPFKGLYQVGDSVFPAQGWPGVVAGANNLMRVIDG